MTPKIEAAMPRVKKLEWNSTSYGTPEAKTVAGVYRINHAMSGGWSVAAGVRILQEDDGRENFATVERAKAAAQSDYEARILSAIEPPSEEGVTTVIESIKEHRYIDGKDYAKTGAVQRLGEAHVGQTVGATDSREVGWLIERIDLAPFPVWYWEDPYKPGWHDWTKTAHDAKRFASKAEAEAFPDYKLIASDPNIKITEHVFLPALTTSPPDPAPKAVSPDTVGAVLAHCDTLDSCLETFWCMTSAGTDNRLLAEAAQHAAGSIRSLAASPPAQANTRAEALEEAAKIADGMARSFKKAEIERDGVGDYVMGGKFASRSIGAAETAAAIRSLSHPLPEEKEPTK